MHQPRRRIKRLHLDLAMKQVACVDDRRAAGAMQVPSHETNLRDFEGFDREPDETPFRGEAIS